MVGRKVVVVIGLFMMLTPSSETEFGISRPPAPMKSSPPLGLPDGSFLPGRTFGTLVASRSVSMASLMAALSVAMGGGAPDTVTVSVTWPAFIVKSVRTTWLVATTMPVFFTVSNPLMDAVIAYVPALMNWKE